jgi:sorbitol-specific phosphotransferase system component IIBC
MLGELVQTTAGKWITHLAIPMPQRLIALIEIPQACSLKFLTCEQRSV